MVTPDVEAFVLAHSDNRVYDANKAHDYYLRTRQLKGRQPGQVKTAIGRSGTKTSSLVKTTVVKNDPNHAAELRRQAEARVAALQSRLVKLSEVLKELKKQAKARSGVKTPTKTTSSSPRSQPKQHSKPLTAAQKAEAAKKAKERRAKESDPSLTVQAQNLEAKIKKVEDSIKKMKATLAAAKRRSNVKR